MADFGPIFDAGIRTEGGYKLTNIRGDRGGQTYAGIARKKNPQWPGWAHIDRGEMPPTAMVRTFYRDEFWDRIRGDEIADQSIAATIYDFAINAGWRTSAKLAQAVIGVAPDGSIGPVTLAGLNLANAEEFRKSFALAKIQRYADIVNGDRSQEKFLLGWINRTLRELRA